MANTTLTHTASSGNSKTWTFSAWIKLANSDGYEYLYSQGSAGDTWIGIYLGNDNTLRCYNEASGSQTLYFVTNRLFRDQNGWYHIVVQCDTTQATEADRFKIWINGVQETSFSTAAYPAQNSNTSMNINSTIQRIGVYNPSGSSANHYFDGYMSHVALVDGQALAPTVFGSTDSTSGIWKFKSPTGVTWGTNGFHLKFESSGNLGLDSSGETNNFTLGGNGRQALDTPSNVYATLNPLASTTPPATVGFTLSNGNNTVQYTNVSYANFNPSTIGFNKGKWYAECKVSADGSFGGDWPEIGVFYSDNISDIQRTNEGSHTANSMVNGASIVGNGTLYKFGTQTSSYFSGFSTNNIISVAVDSDTGKIWWAVNGTFINSGNPTNGTNENATATANKSLIFYSRWYQPSNNPIVKWNFGNGYFGTTAISSAGSNGNGSLFEYDVPSGYYALNTKNINTYG
tara:strand:- start:405 stop:1778 length:1374 start_codon:yes stop_codon:yes gene_type:complete